MGGKGNLVILEGPDTVPTAAARLRGFKDALKEFPDVKIVLSKNAMYARPPAADLLKSMLKLKPPPQIDGVLAANAAQFDTRGAIAGYVWISNAWQSAVILAQPVATGVTGGGAPMKR